MRVTPKLISSKMPMTSPETAGNMWHRDCQGVMVFRGHRLTSRLQGIRWNRRGPSDTMEWLAWVLERKGGLECSGAKV